MSRQPSTDRIPYAVLHWGAWQLAIPAALVHQARPYRAPRALSEAAPPVTGWLEQEQCAALELSHALLPAHANSGDSHNAADDNRGGQLHPGYHAILRQQEMRLALRVDRLDGVRDLPQSLLDSAQAHPDWALLAGLTLDDGTTLQILDACALMQQAAAAVAALEMAQASGATPPEQELRLLPPMGVFLLDGQRYALPATLIHEVIATPPVSTAFLWGGPLRGVADWRGRHVYLLAPQQLGATQSSTSMLAVIGDGLGYLGLPIDAALTLRRYRQDQLSAADDGHLHAGLIVDDQAEPIRLLDSAALLQLIPRTPGGAQQSASDASQQRAREAFLVCQAGIRLAIPLQQVEQVCLLPDTLAAAEPDPSGSVSITWRGQELPLHTLGAAPTRMLVLKHDGLSYGLLVDAVETLLPALSASLPRSISVAGKTLRVISTRSASYTLFEPEQLNHFSTH